MKVLPNEHTAMLKTIARIRADINTLSRMMLDTGLSSPRDRWQVALMSLSVKLLTLRGILEGTTDMFPPKEEDPLP